MLNAPVFEVGDRVRAVVNGYRFTGVIVRIDVVRQTACIEKANGSCLWVPMVAIESPNS